MTRGDITKEVWKRLYHNATIDAGNGNGDASDDGGASDRGSTIPIPADPLKQALKQQGQAPDLYHIPTDTVMRMMSLCVVAEQCSDLLLELVVAVDAYVQYSGLRLPDSTFATGNAHV